MKSFYEFYLQIQRENAAAPAAPGAAPAAPAAAPAAGAPAAAAPAAGAAPAAPGAAPAAPGAAGTAKPVAPQDPGIANLAAAITKNPAGFKVYKDALGQIKDTKLKPAVDSLLTALNLPK